MTQHVDRLDRKLWDEHWHLLCHRSEVERPSAFVHFDILGEEVVAFHDGAEVVVFDNRCPHRGARIFDGSHGQQRFLCRYHGWSFSKGRLFIPAKETFTTCDPFQARLNTYETDWIGDFLFVSRRPGIPLRDQLAGVDHAVEAISASISSRRDFNSYIYSCNWKIAVENALDQYHVAIIHRDTLNRLRLEPARDEYIGLNNVSTAAIGDERVFKRLKGMSRFFDIAFQQQEYVAIHLFPFTFLTSTFGYSYSLQQFYPSPDPNQTHFGSRFYQARLSTRISPQTMDSFFDSSVSVNHEVFREDAEICARVPSDSWSPEPPPFVSGGEEKIVQFRRLMADFQAHETAAITG